MATVCGWQWWAPDSTRLVEKLWVELPFQELRWEGGGWNGGGGWRGCSYLCDFPSGDGEPREQGWRGERRARLWLDMLQLRQARPQTRWAPPHSYQHLEKHIFFVTTREQQIFPVLVCWSLVIVCVCLETCCYSERLYKLMTPHNSTQNKR